MLCSVFTSPYIDVYSFRNPPGYGPILYALIDVSNLRQVLLGLDKWRASEEAKQSPLLAWHISSLLIYSCVLPRMAICASVVVATNDLHRRTTPRSIESIARLKSNKCIWDAMVVTFTTPLFRIPIIARSFDDVTWVQAWSVILCGNYCRHHRRLFPLDTWALNDRNLFLERLRLFVLFQEFQD